MQVNKRFYFLLFLAVLIFVLWLFLEDRLLLSLWLGLLFILLVSFLIARGSLMGVEVIRKSRIKSEEIGGIFEEHFEIQNNSRFPKLWLEVLDKSELSHEVNSRVLYNLKSSRVHLFTSTLILNKRGFFPLGPTQVKSGDPFGVFSTSIIFPAKDSLMVYPKIYQFHEFPLISADKTGSENLRLQTTHSTPQSAGVREYYPGDPLNRVHWPITVKHNRLMVKEFDEETQAGTWIFLDAQAGFYYHSPEKIPAALDRNLLPFRRQKTYQLPDDGLEYAVSMAASIADHYLIKDRYVGFASNMKSVQIITADKGLRQLTKILEALAATCDDGGLTMVDILEKQIRNIPRGSSLVLITANWNKNLNVMLETYNRRGFSTLIILIDNDSFTSGAEQGIPKRKPSLSNLFYVRKGSDFEHLFS